MLIILSDLHLNDGTTGETLSPEAFALFADRLKELAITASWRSDGAYRPIERIDLVLLGDVLDLLHSSRWHAQAASSLGRSAVAGPDRSDHTGLRAISSPRTRSPSPRSAVWPRKARLPFRPCFARPGLPRMPTISR